MSIFRKLWSFAALIAAIDFMEEPNRGIRNAFRVALTPGPRFFERVLVMEIVQSPTHCQTCKAKNRRVKEWPPLRNRKNEPGGSEAVFSLKAGRTIPGFRVAKHLHFQQSRYMELKVAIESFSSLAQETRLRVFKLLIEYGRTGTPAGELSERLGVPQNTLSFHLSHLSHAGLVTSKREGKQIFYFANTKTIENLILYLKENCCVLEAPEKANSCCPLPKSKASKKPAKRAANKPGRYASVGL